MKRLLILLCFPASLMAQTIGAGVTVGSGVTVGAPFVASASGLVFSPTSQHFSSTQAVAVSYTPPSGSVIFYTADGSPVSPASTLYSAPLSLSATATVNAIAYAVGTVRQNVDRSAASWKTDVAATPLPTGSCPNVSVGGGVANNAVDTCTFDTTALSGTALHLAFSSSQTGTSQRQVLWTMSGGKANDATEWTQSFSIQPAENQTLVWAYENDAQLWDDSRRLELTSGLQCLQGNYNSSTGKYSVGMWESSGQSGWSTSHMPACNLTTGVFTHVETHAHRVIGLNACTHTAKITASMSNTQTTIAVTSNLIPGMVLTIDSEQMLVGSYTGTAGVWNVTRGYNGTTATTHAANAALNAPIECVYWDWISIDGVKTNVNNVFPAGVLPPGWSGGCYNQQQLDTTHSGTVGEYIKNKNMTCGYGTLATGSATYTKP